MEVRVDTYVESLDGNREHVNRAYVVMVALDDQGKPVKVPASFGKRRGKGRMGAGEKDACFVNSGGKNIKPSAQPMGFDLVGCPFCLLTNNATKKLQSQNQAESILQSERHCALT